MKSLPESEMWNKLKSRLAVYREEPDHNWNSIVKQLPVETGADVTTKALRALLILLLGWLFVSDVINSNQSVADADIEVANTPADDQMIRKYSPSEPKSRSMHEAPALVDKTTDNNLEASLLPSKGERQLSKQRMMSRRDGVDAHAYQLDQLDKGPAFIPLGGIDSVVNYNARYLETHNNEGSDIKGANKQTLLSKHEPGADSMIVISIVDDTLKRKNSNQSERKSRDKKLMSFYLSATPGLGFYKISPNKNDNVELTSLKSKGIFSPDRLGLSIDIGMSKKLLKNMEWFGGLTYYQQKQSIVYTYVSDEVVNIESEEGSDYTLSPGIKSRRVNYAMQNAGISSGLLYTVKRAALIHQAGFGLQYHYGLSEWKSENDVQNKSQFYLMIQFLYRLKWKTSDHLQVYIQPQYSHGINGQDDNHQVFRIKPSRAGIGIGVIYHLPESR